MSLLRQAGLAAVIVLSALSQGCGDSAFVTDSLVSSSVLEADRAFTAGKLRTYCQSCHAIGELKFIRSDNDEELWKYITETNVPGTSRRWITSIIDVLSWPSDAAPPPGEFKDPGNNRDWMPKGAKRPQLADDTTNGEATRRIMLQALRTRAER